MTAKDLETILLRPSFTFIKPENLTIVNLASILVGPARSLVDAALIGGAYAAIKDSLPPEALIPATTAALLAIGLLGTVNQIDMFITSYKAYKLEQPRIKNKIRNRFSQGKDLP